MKRSIIVFGVLFSALFFTFSQTNTTQQQDSTQNENKKSEASDPTHWLKTRLKAREAMVDRANRNALRVADEELLSDIERTNGDTLKKIEPILYRYLCSVVFLPENLNYIPNVTSALDIMIKKLSDKSYFLSIAGDVNSYPIARNPFVISKLLEGYRLSLESNSDEVFKSFEKCYRNVIYYRINKVYGYDFIIPDFIAFLNEYITLVGQGKIKDQERIMISHISFDMQIGRGKKANEFTKTKEGDELNQSMFEYLSKDKKESK